MPPREPRYSFIALALVAGAAAVVLASARTQAAGGATPDSVAFFEQRIRPILAERCYSCHSEKAEKLRAGLRLDTKDGLLAGGDGGPVVVPGNPEASRLIVAVRYRDKDLKMPPRQKLSPQEIADLEQWVRMGAPDPRAGSATPAVAAPKGAPIDWAKAREWWAYQPVKMPAVPEVKRTDWARSTIDRFILAKLEAKGLSPAAPADKRTLIRRAYFDLIGLPPKPEEVEAFIADSSPDAFAKVVDKLLASPHYGERWGRHWLDLVRYTDSFDARGAGGDADVPESYRYRDWVVKAFNDDLPYDQFVMNQIAGDLLPAKDGTFNADGIVATGMYVIGEWGGGDADKEKMLTDIVDDQIDVTGRAFLGLTIACARCHDHKFDPIPTADYYGLAGVFFSSHILPNPGAKTAGSPVARVELVPPEAKAERKREEARVRDLGVETERLLDDEYVKLAHAILPDIDRYLLAAWEYHNATEGNRGTAPAPLEQFAAAHKLHPYALKRAMDYLGAPTLRLLSDPQRNAQGMAMLNGWRVPGADNPNLLTNASDQPARFLTITLPPKSLAVHPGPKSGVAVAWRAPIDGSFKLTGRIADADAVGGDGIEWAISRIDRLGKKTELVRNDLPNGGTQDIGEGGRAAVLAAVSAQKGEMIEVSVLPKGDYSYDTTVIELHLDEIDGKGREWDLTKEVVPDPLEGGRGNPHSDNYGNKEVWHFYDLAGQMLVGQAPEGSALARWLDLVAGPQTKEKAPDVKAVESAAGLLRDMMVILEGQSDWLQKERTQAFALSGPDVPLYQALTDPRGSFWSAARPDDANLPDEPRKQLAAMRAERESLQAKLAVPVPVAHGFREGGTPNSAYAGIKDARILIRGQYTRPGATVPRHFPQIVAGEQQPALSKESSGRLELAKWVASPQNPLTARVIVNRIWQHHFGEGIVRTPNNFGKLGTPPSHPELLDWLALRFIERGWSVKAIHREIMLSAAYQQSSRPEPATYAADPDNQLFGRQNRQRLDAESLRDSLLAITDSLDETLGGKPVREMEFPRRTLYLMTIRSDRSTFRSLFDAADPGAVVEKRIETTVAPQALFLLNHPFTLDRTKALVQRLLARPLADDGARIDWLYRTLYGRAPTDKEVEIGQGVLAQAKQAEDGSTLSAEQAWQEYCQILLCANEFMFVD